MKNGGLSASENYFYVRHALYIDHPFLSPYTRRMRNVFVCIHGVCTAAPMSTLRGVISSVARGLHVVAITISAAAPKCRVFIMAFS